MKHINSILFASLSLMLAADSGGASGGAAVADIPFDEPPVDGPDSSWINPRDRVASESDILVKLSDIMIDKGTQSRVSLDSDVISEYEGIIKAARASGADIPFPAVVLFREPAGKLYLADGFHRYSSHDLAGEKEILADIIDGTLRDAILYSLGANTDHGIRRKNADKKRAVTTLLNDAEWSKWSNNFLAGLCGVSEFMIRDSRKVTQTPASGEVKTQRGGKTVTVKAAAIGKGKKAGAIDKEAETGKPAAADTGKKGKGKASTPQQDKEDDAKAEKVFKAVAKAFGDPEGEKFRKAYVSGALDVSVKDMRELSDQTPARLAKIYPLITVNQWKPRVAIAFIDREVDSTTKAGDLINHAIARGGEFKIKIDGHTITVSDGKASKAKPAA